MQPKRRTMDTLTHVRTIGGWQRPGEIIKVS